MKFLKSDGLTRVLFYRSIFTLLIGLPIQVLAIPSEYQPLVNDVHKLTLDNGMRILIARRPGAPVFNAQLWVKVGSADELTGKSGSAHLLEHMAFKGTEVIGTNDFSKESKLLEKSETALDEIKKNPTKENQENYNSTTKELENFWVDGEYTRLFEQRGAKGLNAGTSSDYTMYTVNLPASELEFWFYMESERLVKPVFRQFYKELEVVKEERRMRTDDSPSGKLYEALLASSYWSHPYQAPTIGWPADLLNLRKRDAENLHKTYYRPDNMVAVIVGDIDLDLATDLAKRYFGRIEKREEPLVFKQVTPAVQNGERFVKVKYKAESEFLIGYHKPTYPSKDSSHLGILYSLLDEGRSSPFQKVLVQDHQVVSEIYTTERPGERYDSVFVIGGTPNKGVSVEKVLEEIDKILKNLDLSPNILEAAKKRLKVHVLKGLSTNEGLASSLGQRELLFGDWMDLFNELEQVQNATASDINRVIKQYLIPSNRTVAIIDPEK